MWALEAPWTPSQRSVFADTPVAWLGALGTAWLAAGVLTATGTFPRPLLTIVGFTATHGGLLAVALTWGAADAGVRLPVSALPVTVALIGLGALATAVDERGAIALLAVPAWLGVLAARGMLRGIGLGREGSVPAMLLGAACGVLLGAHLLYSASQTLGYPPRAEGAARIAVLWGEDLGAKVLAAECFFRGALFNRLQRRWSFGVAVVLATIATLLRYLVDPLLPGQSEVMVGALVYLTILSGVNCWLLWWSGSLLPALLASALFFLAYRALAIG